MAIVVKMNGNESAYGNFDKTIATKVRLAQIRMLYAEKNSIDIYWRSYCHVNWILLSRGRINELYQYGLSVSAKKHRVF